MRRRVVILTHERDRFVTRAYFMHEVAQVWAQRGIEVVIHEGAGVPPAADLAVAHVDLTVTPDDYAALHQHFPRVINAGVRDIRKSRISANMVQRRDSVQGPVIVKTDLNCGGQAEAHLRPRSRWRQRLRRWLRGRWATVNAIGPEHYEVYDSIGDVPRGVWSNPALVVERFMPERDGDFYCLRTWIFLGDRSTHSRSWSHHPVIKSANVIRREVLGEVPPELMQRRRELGFDFGKFDYVIHNNRAILLDANRTPTVGRFVREEFLPRIEHLADGLDALVSPVEPQSSVLATI